MWVALLFGRNGLGPTYLSIRKQKWQLSWCVCVFRPVIESPWHPASEHFLNICLAAWWLLSWCVVLSTWMCVVLAWSICVPSMFIVGGTCFHHHGSWRTGCFTEAWSCGGYLLSKFQRAGSIYIISLNLHNNRVRKASLLGEAQRLSCVSLKAL